MRAQPTPRASLLARARDVIDFVAVSSPARFALIVFTGLILLLTAILSLPAASADGTVTPLADALFTAVSAICVTGLATLPMGTHWSLFGDIAIVVGFQIGGIGVMTLASMLGLIVSRRLGLRAKLMAASDSNLSRIHHGPVAEGQAVRLGEIGGLLATVAISTLVIETVLTALITPRLLLGGVDPWTATWHGFYFAASAFTNTGFSPNAEGVTAFADDPWFLSVLGVGVILGSLGFPVIFALMRALRGVRLTVHVKLTLVTTGVLFALGSLAILILEWGNEATLGAQDAGTRPLTALFLSAMARSGGFATVDVAELTGATLLSLDMLMFVGGGSASTAGGIKVTTLAVLFLAALAEARGLQHVQAFRRRIPADVIRLAVAVAMWGATIVAGATIALLIITDEPLERVLFDVISAFATCGLSTGFTESAPDAGKYVLAATMWAGRIGTVTLAAALAATQRRQLFNFAEERPIVG